MDFIDRLSEAMRGRCCSPILAGCPPGGIVLDPFVGSGTAAVVARKLGRNFVGIELNSGCVALAKRRPAEATRMEV